MVGSTMLTCVARQEAGVDPSPSHQYPNLDPVDVADDDHDFLGLGLRGGACAEVPRQRTIPKEAR